NTGVAFSMFRDMRWPLILVTGVMLLAVLGAFLSGKVSSKWHIASLSLILAGGVGNLIDRVSLGYVIDYIDFRAIHFAIFNLADSCITIGAVLLCLSIVYEDYIKGRRKRKQESGLTAKDAEDGETAEETASSEVPVPELGEKSGSDSEEAENRGIPEKKNEPEEAQAGTEAAKNTKPPAAGHAFQSESGGEPHE
ncbi:MAG TPA: signal peptidase II, partial [Oscillospiraceae bacterium]|nr:signal peptidase II [Oscillospiraceae bacterium]